MTNNKSQMTNVVAKAQARYLRVSPRKIRAIIDLIRGQRVTAALAILTHLNKGTKVGVQKALKSALSNARQNPSVQTDSLFISGITANNGPMLKRYRAAAMGRATMIRHRTTHLSIELSGEKVKQVKASAATRGRRKRIRKLVQKGKK